MFVIHRLTLKSKTTKTKIFDTKGVMKRKEFYCHVTCVPI